MSHQQTNLKVRKAVKPSALFSLALILAPVVSNAQTDYYNTDSGRPLTIEDASATERYAFELQLAPLRLERARGGIYRWGVEPEIAYGLLPRTQFEIGVPLSYVDAGTGSKQFGVGGVNLSILHNLNVETSIPALALSGDVLLPIGRFAPDAAVFTAKGIATKTLRWARFHINGQYSFANEDELAPATSNSNAGRAEVSRWLAGIAVDRTYPLKATLIGAEIFARKSFESSDEPTWNAALGIRRQLSPTFNVDAGLGKELTGDEQGWFFTFGLAHAFAVRSLLPGK